MDLAGLLKLAGADDGLNAITAKAGIPPGEIGKLLAALSPAMTHGIQQQAESTAGLAGFVRALESGKHQDYVNDPSRLAGNEARLDGNKILGHLFGSKDISRKVALQAESDTGIGASLIKKALPLLAGLVMGAISKTSESGKSLKNADGGGLGSLGGLLQSKDGKTGIDDALAMARKFF